MKKTLLSGLALLVIGSAGCELDENKPLREIRMQVSSAVEIAYIAGKLNQLPIRPELVGTAEIRVSDTQSREIPVEYTSFLDLLVQKLDGKITDYCQKAVLDSKFERYYVHGHINLPYDSGINSNAIRFTFYGRRKDEPQPINRYLFEVTLYDIDNYSEKEDDLVPEAIRLEVHGLTGGLIKHSLYVSGPVEDKTFEDLTKLVYQKGVGQLKAVKRD